MLKLRKLLSLILVAALLPNLVIAEGHVSLNQAGKSSLRHRIEFKAKAEKQATDKRIASAIKEKGQPLSRSGGSALFVKR